jgi:hypothetical protein
MIKKIRLTNPFAAANMNALSYDPLLLAAIAPAMGGLVRDAIPATASAAPMRNPYSAGDGDRFMTRTGAKPMHAPEPIPNKAAKTMIAALDFPGSHKASSIMHVKSSIAIITLKRPYLSAKTLGTVRPKKLRIL